MNEEYKEAILKIYEMHQYCTLCKAKVNPPTCKGCPIYCQTFNDD